MDEISILIRILALLSTGGFSRRIRYDHTLQPQPYDQTHGMKKTLLLFTLLLPLCLLAQNKYTANWQSIDSRPTPEWWTDAKFGIFIHWGMYSVPAYTTKGNYAEWYQNSLMNNAHDGKIQAYHKANFGDRTYYDLADDFHAELFNPDEWARLFEKSGAKYIVLTSKHHDGFCLWPNQQANQTWGFPWNAMDRGPHRDLIGDLFKSLEKTSVKPGLYFSLYEWYNPLWKQDPARFASEHSMPQLYELINKYHPQVIWADGDWDATPETWKSKEFLAWLYGESPVRETIVANDRWGSGVRFHHAGIYTPEYQPDMDFEDHAWEESRGMGFSYGYNRVEDAWDYNSAQTLVLHLVDKVSRGGNFLLDIGPDAHGQIPPIMQERLLEIGKWMQTNGEAIYNTRRWRTSCQWSEGNRELKPELVDGWKTGGDLLLKQTVDPQAGFAVKEAFFTWNPAQNNLYAILPKYPSDRRFVLKDLKIPASSTCTFLDMPGNLKHEIQGNNTVIYLPEYQPDLIKAPYAYTLKISNFGQFVAKPVIHIQYDAETLNPAVSISCPTKDVEIRFTTNGNEPTATASLYSGAISLRNATTIKAKAFKSGILESNTQTEQVKTYKLLPAVNMLKAPKPGLMRQVANPATYSIAGVESGPAQPKEVCTDFSIPASCNTDKCACIWTGYIQMPQTGAYQFWLTSDDGSKLYIDGVTVIDHGGDHSMTEKEDKALLERGWHSIKLVYFNSGGAGAFELKYAPLGTEKQDLGKGIMGH